MVAATCTICSYTWATDASFAGVPQAERLFGRELVVASTALLYANVQFTSCLTLFLFKYDGAGRLGGGICELFMVVFIRELD